MDTQISSRPKRKPLRDLTNAPSLSSLAASYKSKLRPRSSAVTNTSASSDVPVISASCSSTAGSTAPAKPISGKGPGSLKIGLQISSSSVCGAGNYESDDHSHSTLNMVQKKDKEIYAEKDNSAISAFSCPPLRKNRTNGRLKPVGGSLPGTNSVPFQKKQKSMPCSSLAAISASWPSILRVLRKAATGTGSLRFVKKSHARAVILGLHHHPFICSTLISAYSLFGLPILSHFVFFDCSAPNIFLWNSLLASFSNNYCHYQVLTTFQNLRVVSSDSPDGYTLAIVAKALTELSDFRNGISIHSLVKRLGLGLDTVLSNTLMVLYFKCGHPDDAQQVFDEIPVRSVASWNSLISENVNLDGDKEWELVREMLLEGIKPDGFTISALLPLCARGDSTGMMLGRQIHGYIVRQELRLGSELHVGSCLISFYCKCGDVTAGKRVFECELRRNVFTWTAMISGYVESGGFNDALRLFYSMNYIDGIIPSEVTIVTVLPAIGSLAALDNGKQIHGFSFRHCLNAETSVNNALIDMYSKCGSLVSARNVFDDELWLKDAISWSSIISCYGIHGMGEDALFLFKRMCSLGITLDHITGVGVLSACGRAGLVKEGMVIYSSMVKNHGVIPSDEMCSCMVDMLGRAGQLEQALDFINSLQFEPGSSIWGALSGAAASHHNHEIQHLASYFLIEIDPEKPSHYVSLSNFHASFGRWDVVAEVRERMSVRGLRKTPGISWIDVNGRVHSFYVADRSHLCSNMIYEVLDNLSYEMKEATNFYNRTSAWLVSFL